MVSTRSVPPAIAPPEVQRPCQYARCGLGTNRGCAAVLGRRDVRTWRPLDIWAGVKERPIVAVRRGGGKRRSKSRFCARGRARTEVAVRRRRRLLCVEARVVSTRSVPPAIAPPEVPRPCQYPRRGLGQTARVRGRPRPQRCANVAATGHLGGREGEANRCGATWWWVEAPFKITLLCPGTGADRGGRVPTHGVLSINQPALSPDRRGPKAGQ